MTTTETPVVRLTRTIPAAPERVYQAWLDPELIERWMAPGSMSVTRAEVDERVGGAHGVWQSDEGVERGGFESEILELDPGRRIVFAWGFVGPDRSTDPAQVSRLTISFAEAPGGATELTLVHEQLAGIAAVLPGMAEMVERGWGLALDKLEETMARVAR